ATPWALGLVHAAPADYVLVGDVDEIPHGGAIQDAMEADAEDRPTVHCLRRPSHSLLATWRLPLKSDQWNFRWPLIGTVDAFGSCDWAAMRAASGDYHHIDNAGWHLSSMGGPDVVLPRSEE